PVSPWLLTEQDPARARPQRISRLPPTNASPSRPRLGPCIVRRTGGTDGLHEVILSSGGCRAVALPPPNTNQDAGAWCVGPSLLFNSGLPLATRRPKDPLQRNHGGNSSVSSSDSRGEGRGGLVGVVVHTTSEPAVAAMLEGMALFKIGASFGGFESLIIPARLPERSVRPWRDPGTLLRLHVGLEAVEDLIADLEAGFGRLAAALG
ncbi:MAG: PLP-dependent transferase, partial [Candidatus Rokubacteria bacterium]|nr:PLP-dependent transferase [Candidatus Rokubacteria bacterium]